MLSRHYREQLAEAFRAVDAGTITKTRERMDYRENQPRRTHPGATPSYRTEPNRDRQGWLVVLVYAVAIGVVCYMTKGGRL